MNYRRDFKWGGKKIKPRTHTHALKRFSRKVALWFSIFLMRFFKNGIFSLPYWESDSHKLLGNLVLDFQIWINLISTPIDYSVWLLTHMRIQDCYIITIFVRWRFEVTKTHRLVSPCNILLWKSSNIQEKLKEIYSEYFETPHLLAFNYPTIYPIWVFWCFLNKLQTSVHYPESWRF